MESDDTGQHEDSESVLSNQFASGNLKLNVKVRVKYNKPSDSPEIDEFESAGKELTANESKANETAASTRSLYGENVSNTSHRPATDFHSKLSDSHLQTAMDDSPLLQSFQTNLSKSLSSTPIKKKPPADRVDRSASKDDKDELRCIAYPKQVDTQANESELSSLSSNDSLLSITSNTSKTSQSTEQLYDFDETLGTRKSPVVQVCVRIRPMNRYEENNISIRSIVDVDELNSTLNLKGKNEDRVRFKFKFNQLFYSKYNRTDEENQEEIYTRLGQPHLLNLLEGNDLCFIAYGQTGSGKSYTIMGDELTPGLVFRFAKQLFGIATMNRRTDLDKLLGRPTTSEQSTASSTDQQAKSSAVSIESNSSLLAAKKRIAEASEKYGFTDVIDGLSPNNSINSTVRLDERQQRSTEKAGHDKVLRFNEKIECYKDDYVYHEKLLASESEEFSSMDSFKTLELKCEQQYSENLSPGERSNLNILSSLLTKFASQRDSLKVGFSFEISFYEIYNESIYDLLEPSEERIKSKVRYHPTSGPYIVNLTTREIDSMRELERYYELGTRRRSKGSTHSNEQSSRSHAIFTIYITQTHHYHSTLMDTIKTSKLQSKITFVDLAGSERTSTNEPVDDERLREGNSINKSLLTLGKVINRLARINKWIKEKDEEFDEAKNSSNSILYVPYRDSILTWLLRDCFTGKCKTFMIATIAPSSNHYDPTLSTLRYANKARKIKYSFRFSQLPANQSNVDQKPSNGKQRFIVSQVETGPEVQKTDSESQKSDTNRRQTDAAERGATSGTLTTDDSTSRPVLGEEFRLSSYTLYKSNLIEKISELFKEILQK